jgi:hypothetical protein
LHLGGCSGKQVGPNHRWSSTRILAFFCFLLSLPIQMTLLFPKLSYFIIKTSFAATNFIGYFFKYLEQDFPIELFGWLGYICIPSLTAILQGYIAFTQGIFLVPLYFWNLLWHPNGRSILDMLRNHEGHRRLISSYINPYPCTRYCE